MPEEGGLNFNGPILTVFLFGAGGHGKVVLESLLGLGLDATICVLDDNVGRKRCDLLGHKILGGRSYLEKSVDGAAIVPAIGANAIRAEFAKWVVDRGFTLLAVQDLNSVVSPSAYVGPGAFIAPNATVNSCARIGKAAIINTSASVDHDCNVSAAAHVAPGARLCGGVEIGERSLVGAGAIILPGIKVGADVVVGAGSVVTRDLDNNARVAGNPARSI